MTVDVRERTLSTEQQLAMGPTLQASLLSLVEKAAHLGLSDVVLDDCDPLNSWMVSQLMALSIVLDLLKNQKTEGRIS